ncbi:hypothetical protein [Kamptonema sp. UHCC 0994]|uniref:hypothetical protein n=1 Tax=Kamptonema sp. UHCC 0994 TaxID=3031329 RepID=UPI0023B9DF80|nr:hypothetical protein [Kamptonema sp. UHCC 0994]MDF0554922.1 hypothetical protein [Kamptonema sp. UHCC 0994]
MELVLEELAELSGVPIKELEGINPQFFQGGTPEEIAEDIADWWELFAGKADSDAPTFKDFVNLGVGFWNSLVADPNSYNSVKP